MCHVEIRKFAVSVMTNLSSTELWSKVWKTIASSPRFGLSCYRHYTMAFRGSDLMAVFRLLIDQLAEFAQMKKNN